MAKGISLHIGLNRVDSARYEDEEGNPWSGKLFGCENDARDMRAIAQSKQFHPRILLSETATADRVLRELRACVAGLDPGDIFFLSYSGHGSQVPDEDNDERDDAWDETWLLYDRQMLDDELFTELSASPAGTRIFMLSDSCHSGSVNRFRNSSRLLDIIPTAGLPGGALRRWSKTPGRAFGLLDYQRRPEAYRLAASRSTPPESITFESTNLLISGCQDKEESADGPVNGVFTAAVLAVWEQGVFDGSYVDFHREIGERMPSDQRPNLNLVGRPNQGFVEQVPFTI